MANMATYDVRLWCNRCNCVIGTVKGIGPNRQESERVRYHMIGHEQQVHERRANVTNPAPAARRGG